MNIGAATIRRMREIKERGGVPSEYARGFRYQNPIPTLIERGYAVWNPQKRLYVLTPEGEKFLSSNS